MAAISEIEVGMSVFSAENARIGTVQVIEEDRITLLGAPGSGYEGGHYQAAVVLIASVQEGRVVLSKDAEAGLILEEAYSEVRSGTNTGGSSSEPAASSHPRSRPSTAMVVGVLLICAIAVSAVPLLFGGRKKSETRPQRAGEAATTRFGMEDEDDSEVPATGGPLSDDQVPRPAA